MNDINSANSIVSKYKSLMSKNHLIEQIKEYDAQVKNMDKYHKSNDEAALRTLESKNANDQTVNSQELNHIFKQQVRKLLNNKVKENEKVIKSNVSKGIMGNQSKVVDYIMYLSILFAIYFGYIAWKKLQEQKDTLII